jgi:hypothetical protein
MEPGIGFEPTTSALRKPCSTTELPRRVAKRRANYQTAPSAATASDPTIDPGGRRTGSSGVGPWPSGAGGLPGYDPGVHYLIDGYNLAHWLARGDARGDDLDPGDLRELLLSRLAVQRPHDAESIRIYWDRKSTGFRLDDNIWGDWCSQHFVPDADEALIDCVYDSDAPRTLTVVSGDREVVGKSKQLGARVLDAGGLLGSRRR